MTIFSEAMNPTTEIKKVTGQAHPSRQLLVIWAKIVELAAKVSELEGKEARATSTTQDKRIEALAKGRAIAKANREAKANG
jgi:hypothetical protein